MSKSRLIFSFLCLLLISLPASADLNLTVQGGNVKPIPIAISDFHPINESSRVVSQDLVSVMRDNFDDSGYFKFISKNKYPQSAAALQLKPNFTKWKRLGTQALVSGTVEVQKGGRLRVKFKVWDVISKKQIYATSLYTQEKNWRRFAHIISDKVYKQLMGEDGYFDSKIVYVAETGNAKNHKKQLAMMDQDGANNRYLTSVRGLVSTPRFSPDFSKIVYGEYIKGFQHVHLLDMRNGKSQKLGKFQGMSFAPRFSPDGKKIIFSMAINGNTDIYILDISSRKLRRVTKNSAIDTAASFSPDGNKIAFESDRGGSQQIYIKDLRSGQVKRISFKNGFYSTPVWSPRGDLIAFTKQHQGSFYIGVMRSDGSGERFLTKSYLAESPSWSANGRVLTFYEKTRNNKRGQYKSSIYRVDVSGLNKKKINTPKNASDPAWSGLLPN